MLFRVRAHPDYHCTCGFSTVPAGIYLERGCLWLWDWPARAFSMEVPTPVNFSTAASAISETGTVFGYTASGNVFFFLKMIVQGQTPVLCSCAEPSKSTCGTRVAHERHTRWLFACLFEATVRNLFGSLARRSEKAGENCLLGATCTHASRFLCKL